MFFIKYISTAILDDDLENCLVSIKGDIIIFTDNDVEKKIGKLNAYYIDIELALNCGYDVFEVFDFNLNFSKYYHALYDEKKMFFKEELVNDFDVDLTASNLLIIERLEILPVYRKKKIGLAAIHRTIRQFSHSCGFVAIHPFPLQFDSDHDIDNEWTKKMEYDNFTIDEKLAQNKLIAYYKKLGFKQLKKSEIFALNPLSEIPTLQQIGHNNI